MNQVYRKEKFIVFPVENSFIVCNTDKVFKVGHTYVKRMDIAKLMIDLVINKKLPKNSYLVDSLIRITDDNAYIKSLKEFKEDCVSANDISKLMRERSEIQTDRIISR